MTVSNSKTPTGLDEAVRMFAGYVRGENGFDELDFKEWLIEWHEQEIAEARIDELNVMNQRFATATTKEPALEDISYGYNLCRQEWNRLRKDRIEALKEQTKWI